jgi:DNA invertase Pin-like site-specific DNA recombinase
MVALYARVSSDQQAKNNNVDSQIDLLKAKIEADGETLYQTSTTLAGRIDSLINKLSDTR